MLKLSTNLFGGLYLRYSRSPNQYTIRTDFLSIRINIREPGSGYANNASIGINKQNDKGNHD